MTTPTIAVQANWDASTATPSAAPTRPDGAPFRYEMLYAGDTRRAYADDAAGLVEAIVPGYIDLGEEQRWRVRLALAARAQVSVQADLNTSPHMHRTSHAQRAILTGPRFEPPVVPTWDCAVPLVLISTYYEPDGRTPRPRPQNGPPNVMWIDPTDEWSLVSSLHDTGYIALHQIEGD